MDLGVGFFFQCKFWVRGERRHLGHRAKWVRGGGGGAWPGLLSAEGARWELSPATASLLASILLWLRHLGEAAPRHRLGLAREVAVATLCHLPCSLGSHIPGAAAPCSLQSRRTGWSLGDAQPDTQPHGCPGRSPRDLLPSRHPSPDPSTLAPVLPQSFPGAMGVPPQHHPDFSMSNNPIGTVLHPGPLSHDTSWGRHPSAPAAGHGASGCVRTGRNQSEGSARGRGGPQRRN